MPVLVWKEVKARGRDRCRGRAGTNRNVSSCVTINFLVKERRRNTVEMIQRFFRDEEGANLVEYALLVTFIALVVIVGVGFLGNNINLWFNAMGSKVANWTPS